jgi:hypothetical protein
MTRRFFRLTLYVLWCVLIGFASCRREENPRPDPRTTITTDSARTAPAPSFTPAPPARQDSARAGLLRRKGELLMARKKVLASSEMTRAQKDSALRAIEQESVELSKKLLETGP